MFPFPYDSTMKGICASTLLVFGLLSLGSCSVLVKNHGKDRNPSCYKGPEYWCQNLNSAKECGAVKHCSQTTWLHKKLPEDKEDICQICMEMVQEARDQLISNETQDELRQVFEGSCKLILVKAIRKECMKLADEFIPELVDMLASQMNPQMVCATAGLCNSERINRLWLDYKSAKLSGRAEEEEEPERSNPIPGGCDDCRRFIEDTKTIIETHSKEEVLERLLYICDQAQSYADACKYAIVENFPEIYEVLTTDLDSNKICKLVGMCDESLASSVKVVTKGNQDRFTRINDDMECEFCEAMVNHVRDLMNNTTTEDEFLQIMEGLCHASKKEDKCLQFVHRYYKAAYAFVLNELHPRELCSTIGLCKGNVLDRPLWIPIMGGSEDYEQKLASMLSPAKDPESGDELFGEKESADLQSFDSSLLGILSPMAMLPMVEMKPAKELDSIPMVKMTPAEPVHPYKKEDIDELLAGFPASLFEKNYRPNLAADELKNKPFCSICELAMHDLENVLANADEDKKIEELVMDACERLPSSLRKQCDAFISQYGDSVLFILSQQLDPSIVCPRLNLCLKVELSNEIDHFPEWSPPKDVSDIKDCALCHFTVSEVEKRLHTPRTKESIIKELELVCDRLPASLHGQCDDFVTENAPKIIDMLIQEYTPEKICVFLKMCEPKPRDLTLGDFLKKIEEPKWRPLSKIEDMLKLVGDELDQLGMEERFNFAEEEEAKEKQEETNNPLCVMCEFAMAKIDRLLITNATEEDIIKAVRNACYVLPRTVELQCMSFFDLYGEQVIDLLIKQMAPQEVCTALHVCLLIGEDDKSFHMNRCEICEIAVQYFDTLLEDDSVEENIDQILEKVCRIIPAKNRPQCQAVIDTYGPYIASLIGQLASAHEVCEAIDLCQKPGLVHMYGGEQCKLGAPYWCISEQHAKACGELHYCKKSVWKN